MTAGRPKKYKSKKALAEAIERYFSSISRTIPAQEALTGNEIYNDDGERIMLTQYVRPPSICSMCLYLGIDRSTWQNYCDEKLHPEFESVTAMTRARIEAWLEEQLLMREKGVQGIIFNLQNNYGWREKKELELGAKTRSAVSAQNISAYDKIAIIAAAQQETGDIPEYDDEDGEAE